MVENALLCDVRVEVRNELGLDAGPGLAHHGGGAAERWRGTLGRGGQRTLT